MVRPQHLLFSALVAFAWSVASANTQLDSKLATADPDGSTLWYDVQHLGMEGKGWDDTKAPFDRLPARAEGVVRPPVWTLSRDSAGMCVRFETDATTIRVRWTLTSSNLAMPHMPATGVSGLDLYVRSADGPWRWLATGKPSNYPTNQATLASDISPGKRQYVLYLPLYNGVASIEIGVPKTSTLAKLPRPAGRRKPIVFWGTSITQGGCASRTGMVHTAILGRRLDRPVINLGFSGNGKMEPEMAELVAELDAVVFVVDCLPNLVAAEVAARTEPLVRILRKAQPTTPIVLAEDRTYSNAFLVESRRQRNETSRAALAKAYKNLKAAGVPNLHYLPGEGQLGDDNLGTVDGSHPTDLGFLRMADAFEPILEPLVRDNDK